MSHSYLQESNLVAFADAAAGHDGVLSDSSGAVVIKPCTPAEIAFYESAQTSHPAFAAFMPTFMGTLSLAQSGEGEGGPNVPQDPLASTPLDGPVHAAEINAAISRPAPAQEPARTPTAKAGASEPSLPNTLDAKAVRGKKIDTGLGIVLENSAYGFVRPNILDVKLGAQLYDPATASPDKQARLAKTAAGTTSSSLGFRIAGMRVWKGLSAAGKNGVDEAGNRDYGKGYGRAFRAETVAEGFREYFFVESAGLDRRLGRRMARRMAEGVRGIRRMLEAEESRMYGASILFVYEGDGDALRTALEEEAARSSSIDSNVKDAEARGQAESAPEPDEDENEDEDEDEEDGTPKVVNVKLIDFAHAYWTPGQGPDENVLKGVRNVERILDELAEHG